MVAEKTVVVCVVALLTVILPPGIRVQSTISSYSEDDSCSRLEKKWEFHAEEIIRLLGELTKTPPTPPATRSFTRHPELIGIQQTVPVIYTKHSQSDRIPGCPAGFNRIWDGYSLLQTEDDGKIYTQDLGSSGSCMTKFSPMPFMRCTISNVCTYAGSTATSYWLSANASIPLKPVTGDELRKFVSRCSVCQAAAPIITIHSQSSTLPNCPYGWNELWSGYSFVMHSIGGQQLASSGSCLEHFRSNVYVECNSRGQCSFYHDKYSYWLVSLGEEFFHKDVISFEVKDRDNLSRVSRCRVCVYTPELRTE